MSQNILVRALSYAGGMRLLCVRYASAMRPLCVRYAAAMRLLSYDAGVCPAGVCLVVEAWSAPSGPRPG